MTIKEWGIRAPYDGPLTLEYKVGTDVNGVSSADFTSKQLLDANKGCSEFGGGIIRYAPNDKVGEDPNSKSPTATEFFKTEDKSSYAYINGYYYIFKHDQSLCSAINSASDPAAGIQSQTNDAVKSLIPKLVVIPAS